MEIDVVKAFVTIPISKIAASQTQKANRFVKMNLKSFFKKTSTRQKISAGQTKYINKVAPLEYPDKMKRSVVIEIKTTVLGETLSFCLKIKNVYIASMTIIALSA